MRSLELLLEENGEQWEKEKIPCETCNEEQRENESEEELGEEEGGKGSAEGKSLG